MTFGCEVGWQRTGGADAKNASTIFNVAFSTLVRVIVTSAGTEVVFCAIVRTVALLHKAHTFGQLSVANHCSMQTLQYKALHG
jgi:hypothetical protein